MNREQFRATILLGTLLVLIGYAQLAEAQSYYVPGAPTPAGPVYSPRYAAPIVLPARGAYFFEGCTPCMPDQIISCEPDTSGWTAAPSASEQPVPNPNPYGRFPDSQNMEPIRNGEAPSTPTRAELALSDDHPLLRPFQGTYGPVAATYASTNSVVGSNGAIVSEDPGRDLSRSVDATVVSHPTEEQPSVAWGGILPPWMREPPPRSPNVSGSTPDAGPSRSANDVLERYGGVSRFDEPVLRR